MIFIRYLSAFFLFFAVYSEALFGTPFVYVANLRSNSVSVIDVATNTVIATIPVGLAPQFVAITPDGTRAYVTNAGSDNVSAIDVATNTVLATIPVGDTPVGIAITPDGTRAYITNALSDNLTIIDLASNAVIGTVPVGDTPIGIAITPDGTKAYVITTGTNSVTAIDLATNLVIANIPVGAAPMDIAITPDGTKAYVVNSDTNDVTAIDTASNLSIATIPVGIAPLFITIASNGLTAYVSNSESVPGIVTPIDLATNTAGSPIPVGAISLTGLAITADGATLYVAEADDDFAVPGSVIPIDLATNTAGSPIPVELFPFGMAITPVPFPTVTSVLPNSGSINGRTTVTITGTNFQDVKQVLFGDIPALSFIINSSTSIIAISPPGAVGTVDVRVVTSVGTSSITSIDQFTYTPLNLFPPRHLRGHQISKRFATQSDYVNILTWKAPKAGETPVEYRIYRDASLQQLIGAVKANQKLKFKDHYRKKGREYTYFIVSVNSVGVLSDPVSITVTSKR